LLAGITGSNPAGEIDVCVLCVLYSKVKKVKSQDNQDKEVWIKYRQRTQKQTAGGTHVCVECCKGTMHTGRRNKYGKSTKRKKQKEAREKKSR
jgi:hypothetical protein